jgi:hypothetical protein
MNEKSVFLKDCKSFTKVSNALLRSNLSITTIGLMTKLLSYKDFAIHKSTEQKRSGVGRETFNKAWAELEKHGFIKQERVGTGQFVYRWIIINDPPHAAEKYGNNTEAENPQVENQERNTTPGNPQVENQEWNTSDGNVATNIDLINLDVSKVDVSNEDIKNEDVSTVEEIIEEVTYDPIDYGIVVEVDDLPFGWDDD